MDSQKRKSIEIIVDTAVKSFAEGLSVRYEKEADNPLGVINMKKCNCFISELGDEFIFYSAFVRSFDSSMGNMLESLGNNIAKLSYEVKGNIDSFILPDQIQRKASIIDKYLEHEAKPSEKHYSEFDVIYPKNTISFERTHVTDNYFYNPDKNEHYLIELKASGDLDNKKARAEKEALLDEYFLLKNKLRNDKNASIKIYFGTAYNKFGEGNYWKQERVRQFFADEELLIGKDYWNVVCDDINGFDIIINQYKESVKHIKKALLNIKGMYFKEND